MQQDAQVIILLATYNGAQYVGQQIESIFSQSYGNWMLIVSDDGSTDVTPLILAEYQAKCPEKIKLLSTHKPFGRARDNFFYLMENCLDGYIMFCDQDDIWDSHKIERTFCAMRALEAEGFGEQPLLVFTDLEVVDTKMCTLASSFMGFSNLNGSRTALHNLLIHNVITGCTVMINNSLRMLSLQCVDRSQILMHDWWLAIVAAAFGRIFYLNQATVKYRQHTANAIGAKKYSASPANLIKRIFRNSIRQTIKNTTYQAAAFVKTYGGLLKPKDRELAVGFADLYERRKCARLVFMIKYRVLKYGFLRKIAQLVWG